MAARADLVDIPGMGDALGFMANFNRGLGFGAPVVAGVNTARDVLSGNSGPNLFQTYRDELGAQNGTAANFAASNPQAAALARGVGGASIAGMSPANLFAATPDPIDGPALAGAAANIGRGMLAGQDPSAGQALQHRARQIMGATPGLTDAERSAIWSLVTQDSPRGPDGLAKYAPAPQEAWQAIRDIFGTIDSGNQADLANAHRSLQQSPGPAGSGLRRIIAARLGPYPWDFSQGR